jgi:hypothetical protein
MSPTFNVTATSLKLRVMGEMVAAIPTIKSPMKILLPRSTGQYGMTDTEKLSTRTPHTVKFGKSEFFGIEDFLI